MRTALSKDAIIMLHAAIMLIAACSKRGGQPPVPPPPNLVLLSSSVAGNDAPEVIGAPLTPAIVFQFSERLDRTSLSNAVSFSKGSGAGVGFTASLAAGDSSLVVVPAGPLQGLERFIVRVNTALRSAAGGGLTSPVERSFITQIDSTPKFPLLTDEALLTKIQEQTFSYFWQFAHPVSGLIRERNTSGDLVTSGGSGFGMMAMVVGVHRGFITRMQAVERLLTITDFLQNKAQRFKGAFPHWLNGISGVVIPFSPRDNGADLVETSLLAMGMIAAKQYFSGSGSEETLLRNRINSLLEGIEWSWFRRNQEKVLYWHWSPDNGWAINLKIEGWNECLITYVLAAGSTTHAIPADVYHQGYARNGAQRNGKSFYGYKLPLGPDFGGPLFFSHYSFLGIDPRGLTDQYADYWQQQVAHSRINHAYCLQNPLNWFGYSGSCWGLTASDIPNGYAASSPTNDLGVIAPTAAISALPYSPAESMAALRFFYYTLGDRLWGTHGFVDAFKLRDLWFASSYLAIDQGPQVVMIENYRSGLIWNLMQTAPEIKRGLQSLGFQAPYL